MDDTPSRRARAPVATAYAAVLTLIAFATAFEVFLARAAVAPFLSTAFAVAIALSTWWFGRGPGVAAVVLSALAADYLFLTPGTLFYFQTIDESVAFGAMGVGWVGVVVLVEANRWAIGAAVSDRARAYTEAAQYRRIAELTAALGRSPSRAAVIEASVLEPLQALGADAAMLLLMGDDPRSATVARAAGYDDPALAATEVVPLPAGTPLAQVVERRVPIVVESHDARLAEYPGVGAAPYEAAYAAMAGLPLMAGGRVVAVIRFDFRSPRVFTREDAEFLAIVATHAGQALERASQHESAQRALTEAEGLRERANQELAQRQQTERALRASETRYRALATRTSRLHGLTSALSEAVTVDAVAAVVVQHATAVVGATMGSLWLLSGDRSHFTALPRGGGEPSRLAVEPGVCEVDAAHGGVPVYVHSWHEMQEKYWRSASAAADAAYASSAALPLLVNGDAVGVLRFDFSVPVNFDDEYRELLHSAAQHCTQALDRARLYESSQRARADAEGANRLKDEFLSIVSHELRTPLNAVLGWASMLRKGTVDTTLVPRAVQSIYDNATRQAKLIDDLLDVSRIAAGRATLDLQEIDLATLVAGVVESFIPVAASSSVDLRLAPMPRPMISGDRRRLEQVFFNLLANALKFTPAGGRIDIDADLSSGQVEVRVKDNGIGIDPEFLPHVFERFRQANSTSTRNYGGLGLGLSIAKQLVEAHKGTITVESTGKGQGTVFAVTLPLTQDADGRPEELIALPRVPSRPAIPSRLDGIRVLLVDDEPDALEVMRYGLTETGARVTVANRAAEAFNALTRSSFDVLLADIAMPDEDGCSLIRRVRACADREIASIPAAAVTAHARDEEKREVLAAGFHLHLVKPIDPTELGRAVSELAFGGAGRRAQIA